MVYEEGYCPFYPVGHRLCYIKVSDGILRCHLGKRFVTTMK